MYPSTLTLHDAKGQRKYLNQTERLQFLECLKNKALHIQLFCQLLFYTGARISEIHNLRVEHIDFSNKTVVLETLKKRKKGVFREIPIPDFLLQSLADYIQDLESTSVLWHFTIRTASRYIKDVMWEAGIEDVRASAKSLRHGYAVNAVQKAPITMVQKWLGHAHLETTAIYLNILGAEERVIAEKVWLLE